MARFFKNQYLDEVVKDFARYLDGPINCIPSLLKPTSGPRPSPNNSLSPFNLILLPWASLVLFHSFFLYLQHTCRGKEGVWGVKTHCQFFSEIPITGIAIFCKTFK